MTASKRRRYKEHAAKREAGGYVPMPHAVLRSPEFAALSPRAIKLLCDLLAQYKGDNNGDLCAAMKQMKGRGWQGAATLARAVAELKDASFVVTTRQGGRHMASLFGVTFFSIDGCGGKLDIQAPSRSFLGAWRRTGGTSSAPPVDQKGLDYSTSGLIGPKDSAISPPVDQSEPNRALDCSTSGHLYREPLPAADSRRRFCESC